MKRQDLTHKIFNSWTVIKKAGSYIRNDNVKGDTLWECKCKCGFIKKIRSFHLTNGYSKQCRKCADKSVGVRRRSNFKDDEVNWQFWNRHIIYQAKRRNIEVCITLKEANDIFVKQNRKCSLTGIELKFPKFRKDSSATASLDRIDSNKGYVEGNVHWIHKDINIMKNDYSLERFLEVCKLVAFNKKL